MTISILRMNAQRRGWIPGVSRMPKDVDYDRSKPAGFSMTNISGVQLYGVYMVMAPGHATPNPEGVTLRMTNLFICPRNLRFWRRLWAAWQLMRYG